MTDITKKNQKGRRKGKERNKSIKEKEPWPKNRVGNQTAINEKSVYLDELEREEQEEEKEHTKKERSDRLR